MHRGRVALLAVLLAAAVSLSCGAAPALVSSGTTQQAPAACTGQACALGSGTQAVRVFVEPNAGRAPILSAIEGATTSLWVEVYLLTDTTTIQALEDAAGRGIDVRVLLDANPYGVGTTSPHVTLAKLSAAGVKTEDADPAYHYTHAKVMLVDGATAYIMTSNLSHSALGGSSGATNREYGVIDTDPADVAEVKDIFQADWSRTIPRLGDANLVVSPVDARAKLLALLGGVRKSLQIEDEEMVDPQSEDALIAAAHRGVAVDVVLPAPTGGGSSPDVTRLAQGGVHIRYSTTLYMHAKLIIADGQRAFVGSENFSANSLDDNREVGVILAQSDGLATLAAAFGSDWSTGQAVGNN